MSNLLRILLFVPPLFLFSLPSFAQLSGTIEQDPNNGIYTVSLVPTVTWAPPQSITVSASLTLRAATGSLQVADLQSITGLWVLNGVFNAPPEEPNYDYFSFALQNVPLANVTYNNGVIKPLFTFKNDFGCTVVEIIDNATDPFNIEPNSQSVSIENYFGVVAVGNGTNAYIGNTAQAATECPPLVLFANAAANPVPCYQNLTTYSLTVSGGQPPYDIHWENTSNAGFLGDLAVASNGGSAELTGMPAGNYVFTVTDALDSTYTAYDTLLQPEILRFDIRGNEVPCTGNYDGEAEVYNIHGGTGAYHFNWLNYPNETDAVLNDITAGTYYVTVTDDNGCSANDTIIVSAAAPVAIILSQTVVKNISCYGEKDGLIDLYPISSSGGQVFDFLWSPNANAGNESSAWQLGPGNYAVTVTDVEFGCEATVSYSINEPPAIEVDYRLSEPRCFGEKGELQIIGISNAVGQWEAAIIGGNSTYEDSTFILEPGIPLQLVVEDSKGCTVTEDFIVAAKQELSLEIGESHSIKYGEEIQFETAYFPFDNVVFEWTPAIGLSCTDCPNPIAKPTEDVSYRLQMTDSAGCTISDIVNVAVRMSRDVYIPNSFSPNGDGINDAFYPYGGFEIVAIHSMRVFDRWGGTVFEQTEKFAPNDQDAGWKGVAKTKEADPGLYLYTMDVEFIDGAIMLFAGEVQLMR